MRVVLEVLEVRVVRVAREVSGGYQRRRRDLEGASGILGKRTQSAVSLVSSMRFVDGNCSCACESEHGDYFENTSGPGAS